MTWATAVTIGRYTNIALAGATLLLLAVTIRQWRYRSAGNRFLWMGVALFLANTMYGTADVLSHNPGGDGGWRVAVQTVALVWTAAALWLKKRGKWYANEYTHAHGGYRGDGGQVDASGPADTAGPGTAA